MHKKIEVCEEVYESTLVLIRTLEKSLGELDVILSDLGLSLNILGIKATAVRYGLEAMKECKE